jgi:hypothetical protein
LTTGAAQAEHEGARSETRYLGEDLIFVISQPRSGSTLLQRMLAGHSWIQTSAETWLMLHPAYGLRRKGIETDYRAAWAVGAVKEFLENYADGRETWLDGIRAFARTVYGAALRRGGRRRFLDKTPRYTMILPELAELFPEARYLLLLRNPLAVLSSELRTYIQEDWPRLADFAPDLIDAPAQLVAARALLGERLREVRYETLVREPEQQLRRLCRYLEIPWEPGLDDYADTPAPLGRANDPVGVNRHRRPSMDSLETWRQLGRDDQTRTFALAYLDEIGDQVVSDLGYDPALLRAAIEAEPVTRRRRRIYPWRIAVKPMAHWTLRERMASSYYFAAEARGPVAGLGAAARTVVSRFARSIMRLVGRRPTPRPAPGRDYGYHDGS